MNYYLRKTFPVNENEKKLTFLYVIQTNFHFIESIAQDRRRSLQTRFVLISSTVSRTERNIKPNAAKPAANLPKLFKGPPQRGPNKKNKISDFFVGKHAFLRRDSRNCSQERGISRRRFRETGARLPKYAFLRRSTTIFFENCPKKFKMTSASENFRLGVRSNTNKKTAPPKRTPIKTPAEPMPAELTERDRRRNISLINSLLFDSRFHHAKTGLSERPPSSCRGLVGESSPPPDLFFQSNGRSRHLK